jgi:hypothetical protein
METDKDVARAARFLLSQHGNDALVVAEGRAELLADARQFSAAEIWLDVVAEIRRIIASQKSETDAPVDV